MILISLVKSGHSIGIQRSKNRQNRMQISPDRVRLNSGRPIVLHRGNLAANHAPESLIAVGSILDHRIEVGIKHYHPMVIRVKLATKKKC